MLLVTEDWKFYVHKKLLCSPSFAFQISKIEIGITVGGAFLSSASNVLFDNDDLLKVFQKNMDGIQLLEKLENIFLGLQIVLSDQRISKHQIDSWASG